VALLGRAPQPGDTIAEAGDDAVTAQIYQTQSIGAFGIARSGRPPE
jgi:hypothetical protein